jgi:polygalacturonase
MGLRSAILGLLAITIISAYAGSQPVVNHGDEDDLYQGIEFQMSHVKEPLIPHFSVVLTDFGAIPDGMTLCTNAFSDAIENLANKCVGRLIVPRGTWITGPITLKNNIELHTEPGALVVFSTDKTMYPLVETNFEGFNTFRCQSPINGRNLEHTAITGDGVFDGSGDAWRPVKKEKLTDSQWKKLVVSGGIVSENGKTWYPSEQFMKGEKIAEMNVPRSLKTREEFEQIRDFLRPVMVSLISCKKVLIDGPTFQNSPAWCLHPLMCEDLTVRYTTVKNPWYSQNGDGIDIESCRNTIVHDCNFDVGDDAICIKSGKDKDGRDRGIPNENLIVKNCIVYHGHGGVTVGSEMSGGVRNMHVSNCTFTGTDVGLRFKSNRGRGGVVENIYITDISMMNISTQAISFNLFYDGKSASEDLEQGSEGKVETIFQVSEETPQFTNILIRNITCKGALQAIFLQGLPEMNLSNITVENVFMSSKLGLSCSDADHVILKNINLEIASGDGVEIKNCKHVELENFKCTGIFNKQVTISGQKTASIRLSKNGEKVNPGMVKIGKEVDPKAITY